MKVHPADSLPRPAGARTTDRKVPGPLMLRRIVIVTILLLCGAACGAAVVLFAGCNRDHWAGRDAFEADLAPDDRPRPAVAAPLRPVKSIDRALVISIDGLRPDLLARG